MITTVAGRNSAPPLLLLTDIRTGTFWIVTVIHIALAATHKDAIGVFLTNVAIPVGEICLRISFLVLVVLAGLSICTSWEVTGLRITLNRRAAVDSRRALELTIFQLSLWILVLADFSICTFRKVTGILVAFELTFGQSRFCASLGDAVGAVGTVRKGAIASTAHYLDAALTSRTLD